MTGRVRDVMIGSADPEELSRFWSSLLELPSEGRRDQAVKVALRGDVGLLFSPTPSRKQGKNRIHVDLASTTTDHQKTIVERALRLGAVAVDIGQGSVPWVVLADPEGNEFCVLEPRDEYSDTGPIAAVVIDSLNPPALAQFWSRALGLPVERERADFASLRQKPGFWVEFVRVAEINTAGSRVRLGVVQPAGGVALTDPEGNEFFVVT
ncbi:VOC family protein [Antrihabitans sp. YC2-6]|uniref:VOC family protein n=1 Tax=Antrihabitans sp. YC2-6 TaxID=2799498 RepID=UPI0018F390B0|nr:VOC family protein [Antrihabitans sp. YC2-6]MBJ8343848.1 VOC family protein [Antrihabitans sp. YC2-6]